MKANIRCRSCGHEQVSEVAAPPAVSQTTVVHFNDCEFFAAVNAGASDAWVVANGYPLQVAFLEDVVPN
jgi:hypothetical protein